MGKGLNSNTETGVHGSDPVQRGTLPQVIEAALHCMKSNPAASALALSVLKPALASLLQAGTAIQHPGTPASLPAHA